MSKRNRRLHAHSKVRTFEQLEPRHLLTALAPGPVPLENVNIIDPAAALPASPVVYTSLTPTTPLNPPPASCLNPPTTNFQVSAIWGQVTRDVHCPIGNDAQITTKATIPTGQAVKIWAGAVAFAGDDAINKEFTPGGTLTVIEAFSRADQSAPWKDDSLTRIENRTVIEQNGNKATEIQEHLTTTPNSKTGMKTEKVVEKEQQQNIGLHIEVGVNGVELNGANLALPLQGWVVKSSEASLAWNGGAIPVLENSSGSKHVFLPTPGTETPLSYSHESKSIDRPIAGMETIVDTERIIRYGFRDNPAAPGGGLATKLRVAQTDISAKKITTTFGGSTDWTSYRYYTNTSTVTGNLKEVGAVRSTPLGPGTRDEVASIDYEANIAHLYETRLDPFGNPVPALGLPPAIHIIVQDITDMDDNDRLNLLRIQAHISVVQTAITF